MKFSVKHILFAVFIVAFALGVRALAVAIENDGATGIGVLAGAFIGSFGFTLLGANRWVAWAIGVATTFTMCVIDIIERAYRSPEMEYLWRDPTQAQYSTDSEIGMIVTVVFTFLGTIIGGIGVACGIMCLKFMPRMADNIGDALEAGPPL